MLKQHKHFLPNLLSGSSEAAELFLAEWYGEPERGRVEANVDSGLPSPLVRLYELAAKWPQAMVQNHLLAPPEPADDRIVFYVENQGVYEWATELDGDDDATVWGREPDSAPWAEEEPALGAFVLQLLIFEAIMGAEHGASIAWLPAARLPDVLTQLHPLPCGSWRWPDYPTSFHAGDDRLLAVAAPNRTPADPGDHFSVFIAAHDGAALAFLDDLVDDSWEHFSRRDSA